MATKLIVLRGPSGSGKSTVAKAIRAVQVSPTAIIEQDYFRRIVLKEKDIPNGKNIELIKSVVLFVFSHGYSVILEGIFDRERYGRMFEDVIQNHPDNNYFFYFNISFDETLRRHQQKPNRDEFGETEMRKWYKEMDLLPAVPEEVISEQSTLEETTKRILKAISP